MFGKRSVSGRVVAVAALLLILTAQLFSQSEESLPGWVLFEKGKKSYNNGKLAQALEYFSLSGKEGILTPEAKFWMGKIHEEEGDYLLAEKRYLEALEESRFLYVPDEKWDISYSLAGIYLSQKRYDEYEQLLLSIFDQEMLRDEQTIRREHLYVQMLKESGLDKLLHLYRVHLTYSLEAASQLGVFYARNGEWKGALVKNLYSVLTYFSEGVDYLIRLNPDFAFPADVEEAWDQDEDFLMNVYEGLTESCGSDFHFTRDPSTFIPLNLEDDRTAAEEVIRGKYPDFIMTASLYTLLKLEVDQKFSGMLRDESLYRALFYLGRALYEEGSSDEADMVWQTLSMSSLPSRWKTLAETALKDPVLLPASLIY